MKISFKRKTPSPASPVSRVDGMQVHYAPARREYPRWRWYLILLLVSSPLLFLLGKIALSFLFVTARGYLDLDLREIASPCDGVVEEILAVPGLALEAGTPLVRLRGAPAPEAFSGTAEQGSAAADSRRLLDEEVRYRAEQYDRMVFLNRNNAATAAEVEVARLNLLAARDRLRQIGAPSSGAAAAVPGVVEKEGFFTVLSPDAGTFLGAAVPVGAVVRKGARLALFAFRGKDHPAAHTISVYLDPARIASALPGAQVTVLMPGGGRFPALIEGVEREVRQADIEFSGGALSARSPRIVVRLRMLEDLPERYVISGLPVSVVFRVGHDSSLGRLAQWLRLGPSQPGGAWLNRLNSPVPAPAAS